MEKKKTVLGIDQNLEAVLCYVIGWVTGIVFLVLEKENKFVRFHATQSLIVFLGLFIIGVVFGFIPIIGWIISILLTPVGIVLWIILMFKAFQGEMYRLPVVGDIAAEQVFPEEKQTEETIDITKSDEDTE